MELHRCSDSCSVSFNRYGTYEKRNITLIEINTYKDISMNIICQEALFILTNKRFNFNYFGYDKFYMSRYNSVDFFTLTMSCF